MAGGKGGGQPVLLLFQLLLRYYVSNKSTPEQTVNDSGTSGCSGEPVQQQQLQKVCFVAAANPGPTTAPPSKSKVVGDTAVRGSDDVQ
jgi:hypothetical protein